MLPGAEHGSALQSGSTAPALHMQNFMPFMIFMVKNVVVRHAATRRAAASTLEEIRRCAGAPRPCVAGVVAVHLSRRATNSPWSAAAVLPPSSGKPCFPALLPLR
jgi:hypothetical protein